MVRDYVKTALFFEPGSLGDGIGITLDHKNMPYQTTGFITRVEAYVAIMNITEGGLTYYRFLTQQLYISRIRQYFQRWTFVDVIWICEGLSLQDLHPPTGYYLFI